MRDRIIVAVCALGVLSVIGGILLFANTGGDAADGQGEKKQRERVQAGEGIFVGGPFFNLLFPDQRPDASSPVGSTNAASAVPVTSSSAAGGGGAPAVARPAVAATVRPVAPVCNAGLIAAVVGLLGSLVGGGGGC
jgi:hypothetical protein